MLQLAVPVAELHRTGLDPCHRCFDNWKCLLSVGKPEEELGADNWECLPVPTLRLLIESSTSISDTFIAAYRKFRNQVIQVQLRY